MDMDFCIFMHNFYRGIRNDIPYILAEKQRLFTSYTTFGLKNDGMMNFVKVFKLKSVSMLLIGMNNEDIFYIF